MTPQTEGQKDAGAHVGEWRARLIDIASLDTPLRRILAVGYATLIGLGIATAAQAWLPPIEITASPGIKFPLGVVIIGGFALSLAIGLLLAGFSQASALWRALLFVPVLYWSAIFEGAQADKGNFEVTSLVLFFQIAVAMLFVFAPRLGWWRALLASALVVAVFVAIAIAISLTSIPSYAPTLLLLGLTFALPVIDIALMVTGWDVAEVGLLSASALGRRVPEGQWLRAAMRFMLASIALALAVTLNEIYHGSEGWIVMARAAGLALAVFAIGWAVVRFGWLEAGGAHDHLGYWSVFAVALVFGGSMVLPHQVAPLRQPAPHAYNYTGFNTFSLELPDGWTPLANSMLPLPQHANSPIAPVRRDFGIPGKFPRFGIYGGMVIDNLPDGMKFMPEGIHEIVGVGLLPVTPFPQAVPDGTGWKRGETQTRTRAGKTLTFILWRLEIRTPTLATNKNWYLVCVLGPDDQASQRKLCEKIRRSVQFVPKEKLTQLGRLLSGELLWLVLALGAALAAWRGWRGPALAFVLWAAVVALVRTGGTFAQPGIEDPLLDHGLSADILCAALGLFAFLAVGMEFSFFGTRNSALAAVREIGGSALQATILLSAAFLLYVYAGEGADEYHEVRGAVVCLALTWELWTSGATMTNHGSSGFPRNARVLAFLGYLLLIATCVFVFVERDFDFIDERVRAWDSEGWVAFGIVNLGLAFVLMKHVGRAAAALREARSGYGAQGARPLS